MDNPNNAEIRAMEGRELLYAAPVFAFILWRLYIFCNGEFGTLGGAAGVTLGILIFTWAFWAVRGRVYESAWNFRTRLIAVLVTVASPFIFGLLYIESDISRVVIGVVLLVGVITGLKLGVDDMARRNEQGAPDISE